MKSITWYVNFRNLKEYPIKKDKTMWPVQFPIQITAQILFLVLITVDIAKTGPNCGLHISVKHNMKTHICRGHNHKIIILSLN